MNFTASELTVLQVLHNFTTVQFKQSLVGLNQTTLNGFSLGSTLAYVFNKAGITESYQQVLDRLLKYQWVKFVVDANFPNGRWGINPLCTCGRCCKFVPRVRKSLVSSEHILEKYVRAAAQLDKKRHNRKKVRESDMLYRASDVLPIGSIELKARKRRQTHGNVHAAKSVNESAIRQREEQKKRKLLKLLDYATRELESMKS